MGLKIFKAATRKDNILMTIREALNLATKKLQKKSTPASTRSPRIRESEAGVRSSTRGGSPHLDAEVLLAYVLKKSKEYLFLNPNVQLRRPARSCLAVAGGRKLLRKYFDLISKRALGVPVAYLTNNKEFFGLDFFVNENVLIPRPETEGLVELVLLKIVNKKPLSILDVGTGSGCIIISLAVALRNAELGSASQQKDPEINSGLRSENQYFASDISADALAVAKKNARKHKTRISFKQSDILSSWKNKHFDIIIANLPYLAKLTDPSTKFEPKNALVAANKGLKLYEELFKQLAISPPLRKQGSSQGKTPHQVRGGSSPSLIFLEIGHDQGRTIKKLAAKLLPAFETKIFKDLAGRNRYALLAQKSS